MLTLYLGNKIQGKPRAVTLEVDKKRKKKKKKEKKTNQQKQRNVQMNAIFLQARRCSKVSLKESQQALTQDFCSKGPNFKWLRKEGKVSLSA